MSITYSECEFVALVIQHAIRVRRIVISSLSGSTVFFHILINCLILEKKLLSIKCMFFIFFLIPPEIFVTQ